jgi:hypothetical protein
VVRPSVIGALTKEWGTASRGLPDRFTRQKFEVGRKIVTANWRALDDGPQHFVAQQCEYFGVLVPLQPVLSRPDSSERSAPKGWYLRADGWLP